MTVSPPRQTSANGKVVPPSVLGREYVAAGTISASQLRRTLPSYIDDVTADFGDDLYDRIMVDSQVSACITILKSAILEEGIALSPSIQDSGADGYQRAVQIKETAEQMLEDIDQSLDDVLWDLMGALPLGNRVAEQRYDTGPGPDGRTILHLRSLKVKPRRSTAFVVDKYLNVLGLVADTAGQGRVTASDFTVEQIIPREKFSILTFRPRDNDPRGTSILRPAYDPWWRKRQVLIDYVKYITQFAGPSLFGFTAENAEDGVDADGITRTAEELMCNALLNFQSGTVSVFGHGADVKPLEMKGEGDAFLNAIAECNLEITKAVLTQNLATEEGQHQARAAAEVHQDVLDTIIRQGKRAVVRMVRRDILRNWVRWNWGDDAIPLTPSATLGTTERHDVPALMTAVAALQRSGYPHPSQYPAIDKLIGLPVRDLSMPMPEPDAGPPAQQPPDNADMPDNADTMDGGQDNAAA